MEIVSEILIWHYFVIGKEINNDLIGFITTLG